MSTQYTPVVVGTGQHLQSGKISTGGQRVSEVLAETGSSFVRLQAAQVTAVYAGRATRGVAEALIPKTAIAVVLLPSANHEAADRRRYAFVEKKQHSVYVLAGSFEVTGQLHIKGAADATLLLNQSLGAYFAVTNATVCCAAWSMNVPVVLVNKSQVTAFCLGACQIIEQKAEIEEAAAGRLLPAGLPML